MICVYDIESLSNCFTATFMDVKSHKVYKFAVHKSRNDFAEFVKFALRLEGMIGFNNVGYDYPVLHPFLCKPKDYTSMSGDELAVEIYKRSQHVIESEEREFIEPLVPQRDLYLIWHFNNKARSTSLKWLEICMGYEDVRDMPFSHTHEVTDSELEDVLSYNENDVRATYKFYMEYCRDKIKFRKGLTDKYGVNMMNYSDNKIGEELFMIRLSEKTGISKKQLRKGRTERKIISGHDVIIPDIQFTTDKFASVLNWYKTMIIPVEEALKDDSNKSKIKKQIYFDGVTYDFGLGGVHALRGNGVYENVESVDVSSYYPNLAIQNKWRPAHMGSAFCEVYEEIYIDRTKYGKGTVENAGLKLSLNGAFGQSKAPWSPFYDPEFTMRITINGQLLLAYLCETITVLRAGRIIMANTDGIELEVIDKEKLNKIFDLWQKRYKLKLEYNTYRKIAIRDVNNYIAVDTKGEIKHKGTFEIKKEIYKNQSMKIVAIAVEQYFIYDVPVEKTINDCKDIKLFLIGKRAKTGTLRFRRADEDMKLIDIPLPKTVRYYISRSGGSIVKITKGKKKKPKKEIVSKNQMSLFSVTTKKPVADETVTSFHAGYRMTVLNKIVPKAFDEYGVEKQFYIREAYKVIDAVVNKQTVI